MPLERWDGERLAADLQRAIEDGLDTAAGHMVDRVTAKYGRRGVSTKQIRRGLAEIAKSERQGFTRISERRVDDIKAVRRELSSTRGGGLVDPPGGMPRAREGSLLRSVGWTVRNGQRIIGLERGPASVYGPVHEFGGTIRAKRSPWLLFQLLDGSWRRAKSVTIPKRPVWRPTFREEETSGRLMDEFARGASDSYAQDSRR